MSQANDVTNSIYENNNNTPPGTPFALTAGAAVLISPARRGRKLVCQATTGTAVLGTQASVTAGRGASITGTAIFADESSAPWYASAATGTATLEVLEIY